MKYLRADLSLAGSYRYKDSRRFYRHEMYEIKLAIRQYRSVPDRAVTRIYHYWNTDEEGYRLM